ncbi:short-chain dehydrogenase, putative [Talaromyces stipitatus ATCC 10500]|uniref:Short-chain dehydrogenase, putative n=1 Tax=Talaromyces stipitatus (strain ATCC 10500 / CBS 375.48 / QM 6759 / NRRL 1006) TaxID=441959 RepID=B8MMN3_TALSN|nr:short-chain dehydrogenase, putative [Talaromyces stipitatus ATCC 10500]EED13787.1 short-chain dehydrogenase, putative [Talaromyces stipitatus ATCC 10500]
MPATTHPEYNDSTEALEVAQAFAGNIRGRTVVITGVNRGGIGYATAEAFASQAPTHLIVIGRTMSKLEESIDAMKVKYPDVDYRALHIDLSSQQSVRSAAAKLLSWTDVPTIDFIINSAGIALLPERTFSVDGIEMVFATNHIGHFLFTCLLMPKLIKAAEKSPKGATRIVNVSSGSPTVARMRWSDMKYEKLNKDLPEQEQPFYDLQKAWGIDDPENKSYTPLEAYNVSKVANVLFGIGITKRLYEKHGILGLALHPGIIETELGRNAEPKIKDAVNSLREKGVYSYRPLGAGASTSMVAALDPKLGPGETKDGKENYGSFLSDCQISSNAQPLAVSSSEAEKLWKLSEEMVNQKFEW